uniref:Uncharacterized protein n=1 Tax=Arundo donax TaxID=35708 RepID=A0A0A8YXC5_ARUDO
MLCASARRPDRTMCLSLAVSSPSRMRSGGGSGPVHMDRPRRMRRRGSSRGEEAAAAIGICVAEERSVRRWFVDGNWQHGRVPRREGV